MSSTTFSTSERDESSSTSELISATRTPWLSTCPLMTEEGISVFSRPTFTSSFVFVSYWLVKNSCRVA